MRQEVNEKKFTDPHFVATELQKILEASSLRESCKRAHDNIKHQLREKREKHQDLHLENICQTLETRINQIGRDIDNLNQIFTKKHKDAKTLKVRNNY